MRLLVIRHGPAADRDQWEAQGRDDRLRPLTPDGRREMREAAEGLIRLMPSVDLIATSPLVRAAESAAIVGSAYHSDIVNLDPLSPDRKPDELIPWLRDCPQGQTVALVGHEPHLSTLVGFLLTGKSDSFIDLKKGGACLVDLRGSPQGGGGTLSWLLTRQTLRRLGHSR